MIIAIILLSFMFIAVMYFVFSIFRLNKCHKYVMKILEDVDIKNKKMLTEARVRIEHGEFEGENLDKYTQEIIDESNLIFALFRTIPQYSTMINKFWVPIDKFIPEELKEKLYNEPQRI